MSNIFIITNNFRTKTTSNQPPDPSNGRIVRTDNSLNQSGIAGPDEADHNNITSNLFDEIMAGLKTNVKLVPRGVAQAFPYVMLIMLIMIILGLLVQTHDELDKARQIKRIIAKRKSLEEEHNNFIGLISHYLNTPISMMQGGVDLVATLQRVPREMTDSIQNSLMMLSQKIKSLLTSTSLTSTKRIDSSELPPEIKPYKAFIVMVPIITIGILTTLINWLLSSAGKADLSIINITTQILAFSLLFYALFTTFKYHQATKQSLASAQVLLDREITMANARLHFLSGAVNDIKAEVGGLRKNLPGLTAAPNAKAIKDGYARLQNILSRLQLLAEIEQNQYHGKITNFYLRRTINSVLSKYYPQIATRNITVSVDVPPTLALKQDRQMLELIIGSLVDNAIKFSNKRDAEISIRASVDNGNILLTITDNGVGIDESRINQLFKPFSRAETALRFNYEGLGLSLYLDKVIITKLGGNIAINSHKGNGAQIVIALRPLHKSIKAKKQPTA